MSFRRGGAEIAIIVAGVLLALWTDQAVESRSERQLEHEYLARLLEEVISNRDVARSTRARQASVLTSARSAFAILADDGDLTDPELGLAHIYEATRTFLPGYVDDVFEEMKSTGNFRLLSDPELRSEVFAYYRRLRLPPEFQFASLEYRDIVRGNLPPDVKLEIRDSCLPVDSCSLSVGGAVSMELIRVLRRTQGVRQGLSLVIEQWARGQDDFDDVMADSDSLAALLRAAGGD